MCPITPERKLAAHRFLEQYALGVIDADYSLQTFADCIELGWIEYRAAEKVGSLTMMRPRITMTGRMRLESEKQSS